MASAKSKSARKSAAGSAKSTGKGAATKKRAEMKIGDVKDGSIYVMQAGTPVYIKTADVCALTGKTNQWIGQLTAEGVINKKQTAHGSLYELHEALGSYIEMLEARVEKRTASAAEIDLERLRADAKLKAAKADVAEMDAREREGKMHRSEDVAALTADLIFTLRGSLLALPGRVATELVGVKTAAEAADIVDREVRKIMSEMAMYKYDPEKYEERVRERLKLEARTLLDTEIEEE